MNCQQTRNRILAEQEPEALPESLAAHLAGCSACQEWRRTFLSVERSLRFIPVSASDGRAKVAVLKKIRSAPGQHLDAPDLLLATATPEANHPSPLDFESELPRRRRSFSHLVARFWPAGLIAATLLIGTVAWWNLRGERSPVRTSLPADPLLDELVKLNVQLATTQTAVERVVLLARVADELNQEMREIARADATGENMQSLEEMYRRVVLKGLVEQASQVERSQRERVLGRVADGLALSGERAAQTAREAPEHSANALRDAAETARQGTKEIRRLIQGALS